MISDEFLNKKLTLVIGDDKFNILYFKDSPMHIDRDRCFSIKCELDLSQLAKLDLYQRAAKLVAKAYLYKNDLTKRERELFDSDGYIDLKHYALSDWPLHQAHGQLYINAKLLVDDIEMYTIQGMLLYTLDNDYCEFKVDRCLLLNSSNNSNK